MPNPKVSDCSVLKVPELSDAASFLESALRKRYLVIITGNCQCNYSGRASSSLGWGERVIIIKSDGSVQVHRPVGYEPVNWQPPGCTISVSADELFLKIRVYRPKPRETLDLVFDTLMFVASSKLVDRAEFNLYVSEEQMRNALVSDPNLLEHGLRLIDFERKVEPGFIDFYGRDLQDRFVIVELKRTSAGKDAILQLKKYVDSVNKMMGFNVRGIIAAPNLRSGAQVMLATLGLEYKQLSLRKCAQILQKKKTRKISEFFESEVNR